MRVNWFDVRDVNTGQVSLIYCPAAMTIGGRAWTTSEGNFASLLNFIQEGAGEEKTKKFKSLQKAKDWVEMCWAGARKRVGLA